MIREHPQLRLDGLGRVGSGPGLAGGHDGHRARRAHAGGRSANQVVGAGLHRHGAFGVAPRPGAEDAATAPRGTRRRQPIYFPGRPGWQHRAVEDTGDQRFMAAVPVVGRTYSAQRLVRLGDVDAGGRLRLDAVARYLQDIATDDAVDAGLRSAMSWVVRRTVIRVERTARFREPLTLTTFASGYGRSWAERRTAIRGEQGAGIEVAAGDWNGWRDEARYDLIIGSDVLYDRAAFKPLLLIIEQNLAPGGRVVLSDPGRGEFPPRPTRADN